MIVGPYSQQMDINILKTFGILLDGNYREDNLPFEVYEYIEKYANSPGGNGQDYIVIIFA